MSLFGRKKKAETAPALPLLQTERLVLRAFDENDAVDVFAYAQSPNVGPMAGWKPHQSVEESRAIVQSFIMGGEVWAIVEKKSGHVIGTIGLHAKSRRSIAASRELGYALGESWWGQGFGMESCKAVLRYAFDELHCDIVSVAHFPFNQKSKRLIKKLGFTYEGTLRRAYRLPDGALTDEALYSMTREEYEALQAPAKTSAKGKQEDKTCRR